jgi:hypothetical protein
LMLNVSFPILRPPGTGDPTTLHGVRVAGPHPTCREMSRKCINLSPKVLMIS